MRSAFHRLLHAQNRNNRLLFFSISADPLFVFRRQRCCII